MSLTSLKSAVPTILTCSNLVCKLNKRSVSCTKCWRNCRCASPWGPWLNCFRACSRALDHQVKASSIFVNTAVVKTCWSAICKAPIPRPNDSFVKAKVVGAFVSAPKSVRVGLVCWLDKLLSPSARNFNSRNKNRTTWKPNNMACNRGAEARKEIAHERIHRLESIVRNVRSFLSLSGACSLCASCQLDGVEDVEDTASLRGLRHFTIRHSLLQSLFGTKLRNHQRLGHTDCPLGTFGFLRVSRQHFHSLTFQVEGVGAFGIFLYGLVYQLSLLLSVQIFPLESFLHLPHTKWKKTRKLLEKTWRKQDTDTNDWASSGNLEKFLWK